MEKIRVEELLKKDIRNKVICFPTDTVYGVGALIDDKVAIDKIYQMKIRDKSKPLAILCGNKNDIFRYIKNISKKADELIDKYWPGALTIIFNKKEEIDIRNINDTIAFRMPDSKVSLDILNHFGPMAVTSVNYSNEVEINDLETIALNFEKYIDYLVVDETIFSKVPSTIVDCTSEDIKVIRLGNINV